MRNFVAAAFLATVVLLFFFFFSMHYSSPHIPAPLSPQELLREAERRLRMQEEELIRTRQAAEEASRQLAEVQQRAAEDAHRKLASTLEREKYRQAQAEQRTLKALEEDRLAAFSKLGANVPTSHPCANQTSCTLVPVFFATDRKRADLQHRIDFGPARASTFQLGRAIVTVPRVRHRRVGEIIVPSLFERVFRSMPPEGDFAKHFTIPRGGVHVFASADDFLTAVRDQMSDAGDFHEHAFIFVHGYRTTFESGLYRVAQIAYDLAGSDGRPFGTAFLYSWPSGGQFIGYPHDVESAEFSTSHVRKFIELVVDRSGAKHVHLIAHSMGNRALLGALSEIAQSAQKLTTFNQIILAAPDFDADQFTRVAERVIPLAKGITLYASSNDLAMRAARQVYLNLYRAGDVPESGPLVVPGVDTIDVSSISMDVIATSHSDYAERRELLNDIALLLRKGERPPHQRTPMLKLMKAAKGEFWRLPQ